MSRMRFQVVGVFSILRNDEKQIIQHCDAKTHEIGNNGVILAFRLQVITQESSTLLTVSA